MDSFASSSIIDGRDHDLGHKASRSNSGIIRDCFPICDVVLGAHKIDLDYSLTEGNHFGMTPSYPIVRSSK